MEKCFKLTNLARKVASLNGNGHAKAQPFSRHTFRKEVNAMAHRAGKNDGLVVLEESKHAKHSKKEHAIAAAKKMMIQSPSRTNQCTTWTLQFLIKKVQCC